MIRSSPLVFGDGGMLFRNSTELFFFTLSAFISAMKSSSYRYDFEGVNATVQTLLDNGLADSADKLCNLVLATPGGMSPDHHNIMLELHGDCVFANKQYRRGLQFYRQASNPSGRSTSGCISTPKQAQLRLKECKCHIQMDDLTIALRELEAIPSDLRNVEMQVCLGRLYKNAGLRRHAISTVL